MAAPVGNKFALGNSGGRPAHYNTAEELRTAVISFFDDCTATGTKATITGLALYLGFSSRSSLDDYDKRDDEFSYIIKRAKLCVENSYELNGQTIDIFALKNMGWKDKQEITGGDGAPLMPAVVTIQPIQTTDTPIAESEPE